MRAIRVACTRARLPAPRLGAVRVLLVPRVLPRVRRRSEPRGSRVAGAPGRTRRPAAAPARDRVNRAAPGARHEDRAVITRGDALVDAAVDRLRSPALDRIVYPLSSAADHSLLWHAAGVAQALARGGDLGAAARFSAAMGVESALTNGPVKAAFGRLRPRRPTPRSSTATACAGRSRRRSRPGTRRPRSAPRTLLGGGIGWYGLAAAVAGDPGVRRACTTPPMWSPVPRSGSCWAPGSGRVVARKP